MANEQKPSFGPVDGLEIRIGNGAEEVFKKAIEDQNNEQLGGARSFVAYAAPMTWGPEVTVSSHIGEVTYNISYNAIGDTLVFGRVKYFKGPGAGQRVTEEFMDSTTVTTSNSVANVVCEFKGVPLGSTVNGEVN